MSFLNSALLPALAAARGAAAAHSSAQSAFSAALRVFRRSSTSARPSPSGRASFAGGISCCCSCARLFSGAPAAGVFEAAAAALRFARAGAKRRAAVLIVIDHSLSMEHKGGGLSSRQRAEDEADKILATLGADDSVNIITAGQAPRSCFFELSRNHAEARRFVDGDQAGPDARGFHRRRMRPPRGSCSREAAAGRKSTTCRTSSGGTGPMSTSPHCRPGPALLRRCAPPHLGQSRHSRRHVESDRRCSPATP